jgi:hypothetical protein
MDKKKIKIVRLLLILCFIIFFIVILALLINKNDYPKDNETIENSEMILKLESENNMNINANVEVIINNKSYKVNLEKNDTVKEFLKILPNEFYMKELNGNEKYVNIDKNLPTKTYYPKHIEAGDIMLFGDNCVVVFYKSFDTTFGYTKIGHVDNIEDLGKEDIVIKFDVVE